jgi:hypothetical protein
MRQSWSRLRRLGSDGVQRSEGPAESKQFGMIADINSRREVICLALAAAEVCWAAPIFLALNWAFNPHPPLLLWLGMLILMLGYFYFYRTLVAANLSLRLQQSLLVAGLLLSIALVLRFHVFAGAGLRGVDWFLMPFRSLTDAAVVMPASWVAIILLVYLWSRAIHLANRSLSADHVGFSFRSGVVLLIGASLFMNVFAELDASGFVIAYFFFALVAVALARVEEVSLLPNSTRDPFSGFWIGSAVGAVAVLMFLGLVVAFFFLSGALDTLLRWLSPLVLILQIIVAGLGALFLMLLDWVLALFSVDLAAFGQGLREVLERLGQMLVPPLPAPPPGSEVPTRPLILAIMQATVTIGIPLVIVLLVLLFTWHRLRQKRRGQAQEEGRESLFSAGAVVDNLRTMFKDGLDRLGELAGLVSRFGPSSRFLAAVSIRRIYANLVRMATDSGYPRAKAETPYEYLQTLYVALPGSKEDLQVITDAYINAHYGQVPDDREELQRIRDCWERVRAEEIKERKDQPKGSG